MTSEATGLCTLDRYRGCLLGGAVGDALGAAIEFDDLGTIRRRFGDAGLQDPAEAYGRVGAITDDTQMTLFTAEGLLQADDRIERGAGHPPLQLWAAYQRWLFTQGEKARTDSDVTWNGELHRVPEMRHRRAPGATCIGALSQEPPDLHGEATARNDSKGCGGVMRAAPCGLIRGWGDEGPFRIGTAVAAMTHGHPSGHLSAGALALMIARVSDGSSPYDALIEAIDTVEAKPGGEEVCAALVGALEASRSRQPTAEALEHLGAGWIAEEALAIAVYCVLCCPGDFAATVRLAANHSGDSDSTAAIAGNIAGAALGAKAIPAHWLEVLELRDTIDRLATALHHRFIARQHELDWRLWNKLSEGQLPPHDAYAVEGDLLAGPYPGAKDPAEAERKLEDLLDLGVTYFIDLTEEGESGLVPYAPLLRTLAAARGISVTHVRMPVPDLGVPEPSQMRAVQDTLREAREAGDVVYVHCWGGVGRTGTVIGCQLMESGEHDGTSDMATLAALRVATARAPRPSPETEGQRAMVLAWKSRAAQMNQVNLYHDPLLPHARPALIRDLLDVPATSSHHQLENQSTTVLAWLVDRSPAIAHAVLRLFLGEHGEVVGAVSAKTQLSLPKPGGGALYPDLSMCVSDHQVQLLIEVKVDSDFHSYPEFENRSQPEVYRLLWGPASNNDIRVRAVGTLTRNPDQSGANRADPAHLIARDVSWRELRDRLSELLATAEIEEGTSLIAASLVEAIDTRIAPKPPTKTQIDAFLTKHEPFLDETTLALTRLLGTSLPPKRISGRAYVGRRQALTDTHGETLLVRLYLAAAGSRLSLPGAPDALIVAPERDADGTLEAEASPKVQAAGFLRTKDLDGYVLHRRVWPIHELRSDDAANEIAAALRRTGLVEL